MKSFLKAIILSLTFFFTACSSDLGEFSHDAELPQDEKTCCEAAVTTGDSLNISNGTNSRGWDEISGDQYPFEYIYMISEAEDDYDEFSSRNVLTLPVMNNPGISSTDICFKRKNRKSDKVYLTIDGKTIEIDDCIFSSESNGKATMKVSSSIVTPDNQTVYEPYGDRLFFSDNFEAEYIDNKFKLEVKEIDELGYENENEVWITEGEHLNIPLKRFTSVVHGKFLISDMENLHTHDLSKDKFEAIFGRLEDWSVRIFLENAPTTFTFADRYKYPKGKGIVALSKEKLPFVTGLSHYSEYDILKWREWKGVGAEDKSDPFVFPTNVKYSGTNICFSFYYTGDKKIGYYKGFKKIEWKPILKHTTLKVPIYESFWTGIDELRNNTKYFLTILIDIEDFKNGVTGVYDQNKEYSSRSGVADDDLWGHVMDVPYETTISVEKMK